LSHALRFVLATDSDAPPRAQSVVYRTISRRLIYKNGLNRRQGQWLVRRFDAAINPDGTKNGCQVGVTL
jgi:hypothetical protein